MVEAVFYASRSQLYQDPSRSLERDIRISRVSPNYRHLFLKGAAVKLIGISHVLYNCRPSSDDIFHI
jgi:hypothetical protein